jgi:hypothetical protein
MIEGNFGNRIEQNKKQPEHQDSDYWDNIFGKLAKEDGSLGDYLAELREKHPDEYNKAIAELIKREEIKINDEEPKVPDESESFEKLYNAFETENDEDKTIKDEPKKEIKKKTYDEADSHEREQMSIANDYGLLDYTKLEKREDGKWYFNGIEINEYMKLNLGRDVDDLYPRR